MYVMPEDNDTEEEQAEEEYNPLDDPEYLREEYFEGGPDGEGRTQADIGEEHGVTSSTVSHYMKKHGIETRANVVTDERLDDEDWLREQYEDEELTMQEIADIVGCSDGTVMRRLHQIEGLEVRRSTVGEPAEDDGGDEEAEEESDGEDDEE